MNCCHLSDRRPRQTPPKPPMEEPKEGRSPDRQGLPMSHNVSFFQDGPMTADAQLSRMQAALQQLKLETLSVARFSSLARTSPCCVPPCLAALTRC